MKEQWKDVPGFEGYYQVSNQGRVKSLGNEFNKKEKFLKPRPFKRNKEGKAYMCISIKKKNYSIHRLVARVFLLFDITNPKILVCHKDDNPENNHVDNLFVGTALDNLRDASMKGRTCRKLTEDQVLEIRKLHKEGYSMRKLSRIFPVSFPAIRKIIRKDTFRYI